MNLYKYQWATNLRKDMIKQAGWIKVVIISTPPLPLEKCAILHLNLNLA